MAMTLLTAVRLFRWKYGLELPNLAAAFALGIACYAIISTPLAVSLSPSVRLVLLFFASMNPVIFWWFAVALFDDEFEWSFVKLLPAFVFLVIFVLRLFQVPVVDGLIDERLRQRASRTLSLSAMTFPHEMARLLVAEQLYRAGTILRGEPYHKG